MGRGGLIEIIGGIGRLLLSHAATRLELVFAFKFAAEALAVGSQELSM